MDKAKVRIEEFDMLKGIGMLMVIIGHSFHVWPLYHAFNQIHMPLFFIASGYFFSVKTVDWGGVFLEELQATCLAIYPCFCFHLCVLSLFPPRRQCISTGSTHRINYSKRTRHSIRSFMVLPCFVLV